MKFSWGIQDVCGHTQRETTHQRDSQKQQIEEEARLAQQIIIWNIKIHVIARSSTTEIFYNQDFLKFLWEDLAGDISKGSVSRRQTLSVLCRLGPLQIWSVKLKHPDDLITDKLLCSRLVLMRFLIEWCKTWVDSPHSLALILWIWTSLSEQLLEYNCKLFVKMIS